MSAKLGVRKNVLQVSDEDGNSKFVKWMKE